MFNLFGGRRKAKSAPTVTTTSKQSQPESAPVVSTPAPVASETTDRSSSESAPVLAEQPEAASEETHVPEQAVAVLEAPPPVEKPKELSPLEKLRLEVDGDAISFHDICATLTSSVQPRDSEVIAQEKGALEARMEQTFGVEAGYRQELKKGIDQLKVELDQVELDRNYSRIDMGFLMRRKWSQKYNCPLPLFAAFSLNDAECLITATARRNRGWKITADIACKLQVLNNLIYGDSLKERAIAAYEAEYQRNYRDPRDCEVSLKATFTGAIPNQTREKIQQAKPRFDEIFLVTEAPEWQMSTVVTPAPIPVRDPLVIGRKGDLFWLIDAFDLTPLEAAIKGEWTSDKTNS